MKRPFHGNCLQAAHVSRRAFLEGVVAGGVAFGGLGHLFSAAFMPNLASLADRMAVIRSMTGPSNENCGRL